MSDEQVKNMEEGNPPERRLSVEHNESQKKLSDLQSSEKNISCTAQRPNICTLITIIVMFIMCIVIVAIAPNWAGIVIFIFGLLGFAGVLTWLISVQLHENLVFKIVCICCIGISGVFGLIGGIVGAVSNVVGAAVAAVVFAFIVAILDALIIFFMFRPVGACHLQQSGDGQVTATVTTATKEAK